MIQEIARESSRKIVDTKVSGISFSEIPGQTALFTTYLKDPLSLKPYYPNVKESSLDVASYIPTVLSEYRTDRGDLCDALERINADLGAGVHTRSNIDRLRRDDVVAVVTGQQAGLFGGPLYTVYKALSAIKLAEELSAAGNPAVPVFWMATEDHDLDEVSAAFFLTASGKVHRSSYKPGSFIQNSPVGSVEIDDDIAKVLNELFAAIAPTGFSENVRGQLETAWQAGYSWGRAFGETITSLFSTYGLIALDPLDPDLKRLSAPIYKRAVERSDEMVQGIVNRSRELEIAGYHSQVKVEDDYFPLFWHAANGVRTPIRKNSSGVFRSKTRKDEFTRDELLSMAEIEPQRLSPGVMLRPVVQDYILPTVAYFGGGAEIAYFAQNSVAYEELDRPVTPIFHRQSFTIIEPKSSRTMEKLSLGYADIYKNPESVVMEWSAKNLAPKMSAIFSTAEEAVNTELHRIDQLLSDVDPTLLNNAATRRRKMLYHIGALRKKTLLAFGRKNGDAERRILELFEAVMPGGHLQERSINVFYFINKYGPEFMKRIYDAVDLTDKRHRILEMPHE